MHDSCSRHRTGIADGDKKLYLKLPHDKPSMQTANARMLVQRAGLPERKSTIANIPAFESVSRANALVEDLAFSLFLYPV